MRKIIFGCLLFFVMETQAQDRIFSFTYQSGVLNKGQKELEVWTTMRTQRENYYRAFDHSLEFEVGLGSKLQTAFYLNYGSSKGIVNNNGIESVADETSYSFANEWKLKISDPVANKLGSALYLEYTLSNDESEIETKLIFDKKIGKLTQAFNASGEYAFKNELTQNNTLVEVKKEHEINLELNYGIAYPLCKNLFLGMEVYSYSRYEGNAMKFSTLSAGLGLSYSISGFWMNLSCLPQIKDLTSSKQELTENEKLQTRLIFSYAF